MDGLIGAIIVGGLAGWIASMLTGRNDRQGCLMDIVLGIVGGFLGGLLLSFVGIEGTGGFIGSLIVAVIGAVILVFAVRAIMNRT